MTRIHIGRQPIFDRQNRIVGYELLYRPSSTDWCPIVDGDRATAQVMLHTLSTIGLDRLVGQHNAFFNITRNIFLSRTLQLLPPERVVLEVLEHTVVDASLLESLQSLRREGYRLALDDFVLTEATKPLLPLADLIKIDLLTTPLAEVETLLPLLRRHDVKLLAEKIETVEQYERCRAMGFDFFQGFLLSKPHSFSAPYTAGVQTDRLPPNASLGPPCASFVELTRLIEGDAVLGDWLRHHLNLAHCSCCGGMDLFRQAQDRLGPDILQAWAWIDLLFMAAPADDEHQLNATDQGFCQAGHLLSVLTAQTVASH